MDVLVAVTDAATVADDFRIEDGHVPSTYLEYQLNEWDEYALEAAVSLREAGTVDTVTTVTIGPERLEETIRTALAKGADRAIRVWDATLAERAIPDVGTTTRLLAAVVEREDPDLVLTGVQESDYAFGATGVSVAAAVDYGWAAVVNDLELDVSADTVHVHRELEGGLEEHVDVSLPAVVTIQTGINDPRYASLRGIRQAQQAEIEELTPDALGVSMSATDAGLALRELVKPTSEREARFIDGDPATQATELATVLREMGGGNA